MEDTFDSFNDVNENLKGLEELSSDREAGGPAVPVEGTCEYEEDFRDESGGEGWQIDSGVSMEDREREPKPETRYKHNHELLDPVFCAMLPAYRKMSPADINQMNNMLKEKDLYNQINQQRRLQHSYAATAMKFLNDLVGKFQRKWNELVLKYGVKDKPWIIDMYEKREMWAVSYMRGKFFAGFRTALHSELAKLQSLEESAAKFLTRETKGAKDHVIIRRGQLSTSWDKQKGFRVDSLTDLYRKLYVLNGDTIEEYYETREKILEEIQRKESKKELEKASGSRSTFDDNEGLRDPLRVRHKGSVRGSSSRGLRAKRTTKCSYCRVPGHNRVTCPLRAQSSQMGQPANYPTSHGGDDDVEWQYGTLDEEFIDT
ncbi:hypothetical protein SESBI_33148 [Sesbania bispinosa]|nr:hypothetical protein SESBI_33148 [Sesbania bispinosa]